MKPDVRIVAAAFRVPTDALSRLATQSPRPEIRGMWPTTLWRDLACHALAELGYSQNEIGDIFEISYQQAGSGVRKGHSRLLRLRDHLRRRRLEFWVSFEPTVDDTRAALILARYEDGRELLRESGFSVNPIPWPSSVLGTDRYSPTFPST